MSLRDAYGINSGDPTRPLPFEGVIEPPEWMSAGICSTTDPEAFFPEKGGSTREAKKTCLTCPVRTDCLQYALDNDERFGVWGGLSEHERRKLRKRRCKTCGVVISNARSAPLRCPPCIQQARDESKTRYEQNKRYREAS